MRGPMVIGGISLLAFLLLLSGAALAQGPVTGAPPAAVQAPAKADPAASKEAKRAKRIQRLEARLAGMDKKFAERQAAHEAAKKQLQEDLATLRAGGEPAPRADQGGAGAARNQRMEPGERIDALKKQLAKLEERKRQLEARLAKLQAPPK